MSDLQERHPRKSIAFFSALFGKTREGYYSVSIDRISERQQFEQRILNTVRKIREEAPGIGAYKLFLMLRDVYRNKMIGRDSFYKLLHLNHLMLPPERRRHTTNSNHRFRKYKNLIKGFHPTAPCQLWVADITYIETDEGVCYLHLLTDAFTHEIVGWSLSESLMAIHTLAALDKALDMFKGRDLQGLIHHSDRGTQYCCNLYTERLLSTGVRISMTEDGNPTDNAIAERINGIIKQEWLYRMKRPASIDEARIKLEKIINFYNYKRPHRSICMQTPIAVRKYWLNKDFEMRNNQISSGNIMEIYCK